jgi:predicted regulator of Ras-like GTPase activity (Roadblock/LC7/MglB family)
MMSAFASILQKAVARTPGAIGSAFAASDGEIVDSFASSDPMEWAILTAHYGVVLRYMQSALRTFHYGDAELVLMSHDELDILLHSVAEGYYALLAVGHPAPLGLAIDALTSAAASLREEMG